ncbi:MAG: T9SS type A sorting domain-containing protein [Ignavibacterium album]|uniref:two-component regulator propeller domain-containing protein n=1 Tax=Ignavibacterium album TaxID=591197 RepID=UPI0026F345B8|nr:two-component regulator propeller domain-containing protein [Ignavibacterium album]MBI5662022.1 T9SS type A sorting domain-containing protein [Ignavibacterium album]
MKASVRYKNYRAIFLLTFPLFIFCTTNLKPQSNLIQTIDFDSQNRVVYALTGNYDSSYVVRYDNGSQEIWNMTALYNTPFLWISSCVDNNDNIWAYMQNSLYKFDGSNWTEIPLPVSITSYLKYSDLAAKDDMIYLSIYHSAIYGFPPILRFNKLNSSWKTFDSSNSDIPENILTGKIFIKGDSVFVGSNKGLILIENDSAYVILDTSNSSIETQAIYSFYFDSNGKKWLGTFDKGLVEWIDNDNFRYFNQSNSALPNNFINAIDEDSNGKLWLATDNGFACLWNDTIYSYSNLTSESIAELKVDNQNKIWMGEVGTGRLLVFDGINLSSITDVDNKNNSEIPNNFILYQNYPNPFNPGTKISWHSPVSGWQSLKIYDVLGNEVETLVDGYREAGEYKIEFNTLETRRGLSLTSGVYFYQLRVTNSSDGSEQIFVETKKMILMK